MGFPSSTETFDRPFPTDVGMKENDVDDDSGSVSMLSLSVGYKLDPPESPASPLFNGTGVADGRDVLNTSPGPLPPPNTRSGVGRVGFFCFGAGSIASNDEEPAPDSNRGFFAAGRSLSNSSSSSFGAESVGRPMVIFLGPLFGLGGGREIDEEGAGREIEDFLLGGGSLDSSDDLGGTETISESLSLSLPLP